MPSRAGKERLVFDMTPEQWHQEVGGRGQHLIGLMNIVIKNWEEEVSI